MYDLLIIGGTIVDGTGSAGFAADVAVRQGRIVALGDLRDAAAADRLDVEGLAVCPGFIDMHSHSDTTLLVDGRGLSKIHQGVTTEVVGNCGFSPAPTSAAFLDDLRRFALYIPTGMDFAWRSVCEYLRAFDRGGIALNVVQLVGHGTLRVAAMGFARRPPTAAELTAMQRMLGDAMEGDTELFAREDAVEAEWQVVDPVLGHDATPLYEYEPGTWGPVEADQLIAGDGTWAVPS